MVAGSNPSDPSTNGQAGRDEVPQPVGQVKLGGGAKIQVSQTVPGP